MTLYKDGVAVAQAPTTTVSTIAPRIAAVTWTGKPVTLEAT